MHRACAGIVLASLLALAPRGASAQADEAEARALFERGVAAAREGRWEEARELFTEADARLAHPNIRINLAASLVQTGRLRAAAALYARILEEHADELAERTAEVRAALAGVQARLATIAIRLDGEAPGDVLSVDGEVVSTEAGEATARVDPGAHTVAVRRGDVVIAERVVETAEAARETVAIVLEAPVAASTPIAPPDDAPRVEPNWLAIGLLAGGAAVLAGMLYPMIRIADIQGSDEFMRYRAMYPESVSICDEGDTRLGGLAEICSEGDALFASQWVLLAIGGSAVIAGGVLLFVLGPELAVGASARVRPVLGPGLAALDLRVELP